MRDIKKRSIKYLIILIITISLCGFILYPLFDLILCKFITNSEFVYSFKNYIIQPIIAAIIASSVLWIIDKNTKR